MQASEDKLSSPACGSATGGESGLNKSIALHSPICLGDRLAIRSGLLEITYDTGAKVILQGPVTYEVESAVGGYLAVGKLTALVEKKASKLPSTAWGRAAGGEGGLNQSDRLPSASPLFAVRTPTAIVTDLGTEFGVEVDQQGDTLSHVYHGVVRMQISALNGAGEEPPMVLCENGSARVERKGKGRSKPMLRRVSANPVAFVRAIRPAAKPANFIDLLDIVAGGDGTGHRREHGFDPLTGMEDPSFVAGMHPCDGMYHTTMHRMVDGVFTINASGGPTQLDSTGHVFSGFPKNSGQCCGSIWARAVTVRPQDRKLWENASVGYAYWVYAIHPSLDAIVMPDQHGLLGLHSNAGITFDLEAIRRAHGGRQLARFHAVAGKDCNSLAEIWVLVDGRLEARHLLKPTQNGWSGTIPIDIAIGPTDRFLTLASTDGGDGIDMDWVIFGDPVLLFSSDRKPKEDRR